MSAVWADGSPRSQGNAFGIGFVQPVRPSVSIVNAVGQMRMAPATTARKVVRGDAVNTRLALNSAGKFVQTRMAVPSFSIATIDDKKVNRQRKAAI